MPAISNNARLLSNDVQAKWLIEDFPFRIQLATVFPFFPITGDALRYTTTPALQPGVTIGFEEEIVGRYQDAAGPEPGFYICRDCHPVPSFL